MHALSFAYTLSFPRIDSISANIVRHRHTWETAGSYGTEIGAREDASSPGDMIAGDAKHINSLMSLMNSSSDELKNESWALLSALPTCTPIAQGIRDVIRCGGDWTTYFKEDTLHATAYALQIVYALLCPTDPSAVIDGFSSQDWLKSFLAEGGLCVTQHFMMWRSIMFVW